MRIGIDFDNTLVCSDQLFWILAHDIGVVDESVAHQKSEASKPFGRIFKGRPMVREFSKHHHFQVQLMPLPSFVGLAGKFV